jgi:hypothetical protein
MLLLRMCPFSGNKHICNIRQRVTSEALLPCANVCPKEVLAFKNIGLRRFEKHPGFCVPDSVQLRTVDLLFRVHLMLRRLELVRKGRQGGNVPEIDRLWRLVGEVVSQFHRLM